MLSVYFSIYDKIATCFTGRKFRKMVTNINLNILIFLGITSLHLASENGHHPVVELLLDIGANIVQKDNNGEFILSICLCINLIIRKCLSIILFIHVLYI